VLPADQGREPYGEGRRAGREDCARPWAKARWVQPHSATRGWCGSPLKHTTAPRLTPRFATLRERILGSHIHHRQCKFVALVRYAVPHIVALVARARATKTHGCQPGRSSAAHAPTHCARARDVVTVSGPFSRSGLGVVILPVAAGGPRGGSRTEAPPGTRYNEIYGRSTNRPSLNRGCTARPGTCPRSSPPRRTGCSWQGPGRQRG
jgi:hypothetical protein